MIQKKIIITLIIYMSSLIAWGQNLIEVTSTIVQKVDILEQRIAVTDYLPININLDALKNGQGNIAFWELNDIVCQTKFNVRGLKNFSWFGSSKDKTTSIILTVSNNDIQGLITHKTDVYRIETVNRTYYITKIDQSKYPIEACSKFSESDIPHTLDSDKSLNTDSVNFQPKMISGEPFSCRLRLLVLYTPAAKNAISNISNTIQLAVDEMKQSFINSNVYRDIELVYVGETNYTEVNTSFDLILFKTGSDGYMDEVHNLRIKHQADICILMAKETDFCGQARAIKASAPNAFCVVSYDCATGNYSFAHEVAHLIGCQHHTNDATDAGASSAYPYAHGYKSPQNDWRTIMAYPCSGGCPRLLYWSNPNIFYDGLPMGTTNTYNNARMLNEKIPNAMAYLQPPNTITVQSGDVSVANGGDVIAKTKIETSGTVTIQNGQEYSFRSGETVILESGFVAEIGSDFIAEIVGVADCGESDGEDSDYGLTTDLPDYLSKKSEELIPRFSVYPNPISDIITVNTEFANKGTAEFTIYDFTGNIVKELGKYSVSNGYFNKEFNLSNLANGVYFIFLSFDNQEILSFKIIKNT